MREQSQRAAKPVSPEVDKANASGQYLGPSPSCETNEAMRISPDRHQHRQLLPLNIPSRWRLLALCLASMAAWWLFRHEDVVGGASEGSDVRVQLALKRFEESLLLCSAIKQFPTKLDPQNRTANPRWNDITGQRRPIILRNATLFDGESIHPEPMDIMLDKGLITKVASTASAVMGPTVHLEFNTVRKACAS